MSITKFTYRETGYFSKLINDYLEANAKLSGLYKYPLQMDAFQEIIEERRKHQPDRPLLVKLLKEQYGALANAPIVQENIQALSDENTFCVTTAHQPLLFGGPLYFIFKIVSAIKLTTQLTKAFPKYKFVPVFWLGGEDHDFAEMNHAKVFGENIVWDTDFKGGSVGRMGTDSISPAIEQLNRLLGDSDYAKELIGIFTKSYSNAAYPEWNFNQGTRYWLHALFGNEGLVVIDADNAELKAGLVELMKRDLFQRDHAELLKPVLGFLEDYYKIQARPRRINLFYLRENVRERIEYDEQKAVYNVLNTKLSFTKAQLEAELTMHPERFSPNVILRPMYQEKILPNLAFIGGGGELAYWLELKALFEANHITYPMLVLRDSFAIATSRTIKKWNALHTDWNSIFEDKDRLIRKFLEHDFAEDLQLKMEKDDLAILYKRIEESAGSVDSTLKNTVRSEAHRSLKSLQKLEDKMLKAAKRKREIEVQRLTDVKSALFPGNMLQERHDNFSMYYARFGKFFIQMLLDAADPLESKFKLMTED